MAAAPIRHKERSGRVAGDAVSKVPAHRGVGEGEEKEEKKKEKKEI